MNKIITTSKPQVVVAYLRTASRRRPSYQLGLDRQWRTCKAYADHFGVRITRIYADVGISGAREERPALTELIADLSQGKICRVIVADPVRLARNQELGKRLIKCIQRRGGAISFACIALSELLSERRIYIVTSHTDED